MPRYMCSSCHEVVELSGSMRFEWCTACGEPLSTENMLPVMGSPQRTPVQTASGSAGAGAEVAAPALAATTNPIASSSLPTSVSPPTT